MKWHEVRELFPDQFVLVSILQYHEEDNKKVVDEVAPIRTVSEQDANKEFFRVDPGNVVYHTIGQIIDVKKDRNIIIVKGLGRGHRKILIKDSHILNMMQPNELIEITRLKYTKMITRKVYQDQELQL